MPRGFDDSLPPHLFSRTSQDGTRIQNTLIPFVICRDRKPLYSVMYHLIYNGHDLICETYYPFDTPNICSYIAEFRKYIDKHGLAETYIKNWGVE